MHDATDAMVMGNVEFAIASAYCRWGQSEWVSEESVVQ